MGTSFSPTKEGYYGQFGGAFIPELLYPNVKELEDQYLDIIYSDSFQRIPRVIETICWAPHTFVSCKRLSEKYGQPFI